MSTETMSKHTPQKLRMAFEQEKVSGITRLDYQGWLESIACAYANKHSAAPDLLEACKRFCERVANASDDARFTGAARDIVMTSVDEMQAAISKAQP